MVGGFSFLKGGMCETNVLFSTETYTNLAIQYYFPLTLVFESISIIHVHKRESDMF